TDAALLGGIFRCVHTIKGNSSFLGFAVLQSLTHAGENLLSSLRARKTTLTPAMSTALFELVDAVRKMLDAIAATGRDGGVEAGALRARLAGLAAAPERLLPPEPEPPTTTSLDPDALPRVATPAESTIRVDVGLLDRLMNLVGELVLSRNGIVRQA